MIYRFSVLELKTLIKGSGFSKIAGLRLDAASLKGDEVIKTLNNMHNEGIIRSNGTDFILSEKIREIIDIIGRSDEYFAIHTPVPELSDLCVYLLDDTVIVSSQNEGFISIEELPLSEFFTSLSDSGYIPTRSEGVDFSEEDLPEYEREIFNDLDPNEPLSDGSSVLFSIEELNVQKEHLSYIRVADFNLFTYIITWNREKTERIPYTTDNLNKCILEMLYDNN